MKLFHNCECAYCDTPLKWWNAQTCTKCQRSMCNQHATISRYSQKSVLQAVCTDCDERVGAVSVLSVVSSSPQEYIPEQRMAVV